MIAHGTCKATGCREYYFHPDIHYCEYHHRQMKTEDDMLKVEKDKVEYLKEINDKLAVMAESGLMQPRHKP